MAEFFGKYIVVIQKNEASNDNVSLLIKSVLSYMGEITSGLGQVNMRTRIIHICETWRKEGELISSDSWTENKDDVPKRWFAKGSNIQYPARIDLKLFSKPDNINQLECIKDDLKLIILFSDSNDEDSEVELIIALLRKKYPETLIVAECTAFDKKRYFEIAGANVVFNRKSIFNRAFHLKLDNSSIPDIIKEMILTRKNDLFENSKIETLLIEDDIILDKSKFEKNKRYLLDNGIKFIGFYILNSNEILIDSSNLKRGDYALLLVPPSKQKYVKQFQENLTN